jgi:selenocysteine lyase/cysteine desulfurase
MDRFAREGGASAGRGPTPSLRLRPHDRECRERLARLFGAPDPARFLFTLNTTGALNLAPRVLERATMW